MKPTFFKLSKLMKKSINSLHSVSKLQADFNVAKFAGFSLPKLTKELKKNMTYIRNIYHPLMFGSINQTKLASTVFLKEVVSLFSQKIKNKSKLKFKFYSAHGLNFKNKKFKNLIIKIFFKKRYYFNFISYSFEFNKL